MSTLGKLRHRFEWSWLGAGAYYLREVWWHKMIIGKPPARWAKAVRRDRIIVWTFVAVASLLLGALGWAMYGSVAGVAWMIVKVLIVPFLAFTYVIASFVHVHHVQPGIRWWKRREWTKFKGQMEGTTVLRARFGLNFFFHWIMVHVPHHVDMRIPMYNLELATDAIEEAFPGTVHDEPLRFRDFISNTRHCQLYDFDEGHWLTYREAAARTATPPARSRPTPPERRSPFSPAATSGWPLARPGPVAQAGASTVTVSPSGSITWYSKPSSTMAASAPKATAILLAELRTR